MSDLLLTRELEKRTKAFEDGINRLEGAIRDSSISGFAAPERDRADDQLGQRITDAADLLNDSHPRTAIARLDKLLQSEGQTATPRHRFRIKANLGSAYFAMGDKEKAVECFRQAHEEFPHSSEGASILAAAESIAGHRDKAAELAACAMGMPDPQQRAVGVYLENAPDATPWQELQKQIPEKFRNVPEILLVLAEHAQLAGQLRDCRKLAREAVRRDEDNWRVRSHAGYLRFQEVSERDDIRSHRLMRKDDISIVEDARGHFLTAWKTLKETGWLLAAARIGAERFHEVARDLLKHHPHATLILAGYVLNYPGEIDEPTITDSLVEAARNETNSFALDRAAHALIRVEKYSLAADIYLGLCSLDTDTPQLRMALRALVDSRRVKEAKELYGKIDASIKRSASMRRLGASVYLAAAELRSARSELEHVLDTEKENLEDRARWIDICERIPDVAPVIEYLDKVPLDIAGEPRLRMHLAHKIDRLTDGYSKALEIGYRALRDAYDDPVVHVGYMVGLILSGRAGRHLNFERDAVSEDTAVVVKRDRGEAFTRVIESAPNPKVDRGEIPLDDPMAKRLLGKSVGQGIELDSAMGIQTATVEKIISKYLHAYYRAQQDFEQLFPESKIFGALHFDKSDPEASLRPIIESAQERGERVKHIEEAYDSGKIPISLLAGMGGGTPFDFWDYLRHHPKLKIRVAVGSSIERQQAMRATIKAAGVVIDPITLYGAQCLGFADSLSFSGISTGRDASVLGGSNP